MNRAWVMTLLFVGCPATPTDPELSSKAVAVQAWRDGSEALERGESSEAVRSFEAALAQRPDDPVLMAWRGRALAASGDLQGAIAAMDSALAVAPKFPEAAYNRAAYLARAGRLDEAGEGLQRALQLGATDPREVLSDPDFIPHLEHPAFAFVPKTPIIASLEGPGGSVFVGSDAIVKLTLTGLGLDRVEISAPAQSGPFHLSTVEERLETPVGADQRLQLTWTLRALGPGRLVVGPLAIADGDRVVRTEPISLVAVSDREDQPPKQESPQWSRPTSWAAAAPQPPPELSAWRSGGTVWLRVPTATQVRGPDGQPPSIRATRVLDREETWVLYGWSDAAPGAAVSASRGGKQIYSAVPPSIE